MCPVVLSVVSTRQVNPLSWQARVYLFAIISVGCLLMVESMASWNCEDPQRFAVYFVLGCIAGGLKVRVPKMRGTYSLTFLIILIGLCDLTLSETVAIACSSMTVQTIWRSSTKPSLIQGAFNAAACSMSAAIAYATAHLFMPTYLIASLMLAAVSYFATNTLLVSVIISQTEQGHLWKTWANWFHLSTLYYVAGCTAAGTIVVLNRHLGWVFSLLVLPVMYLEYVFYGLRIADQATKSEPMRKSPTA
jgi:hypothetical protein